MSRQKHPSRLYNAIAAAVAISLGHYPLLAVGAASKEFRINPQDQPVEAQVGVSSDAKGNFAATWVSDAGLALRLYSANGSARGGAIALPDTEEASAAAIAMKADGQFVMAWRESSRIAAQRFNATGGAQGQPITVAAVATPSDDTRPALAVDGQGGFVVVWRDGEDLLAKTFDAGGNGKADTVVSQISGDDDGEAAPSVAMDKQGDFAVVWQDYGIWFQRFGADGQAVGDSDEVDTIMDNDSIDATVTAPSVAMDADGDFVVAWAQMEERTSEQTKTTKGKCHVVKEYGYTYKYCDEDSYTTTYTVNSKASVRARRYGKQAGFGKEIELTKTAKQYSYTSENEPEDPPPASGYANTTVAMDASGNFVVGWQFDKVTVTKGKCTTHKEYGETYTYCDEDSYSTRSQIQARKYKANAQPNGAVLSVAKDTAKARVNTTPSVALSGRGDVAFSWTRPAGDEDETVNLFGRAYAKPQ